MGELQERLFVSWVELILCFSKLPGSACDVGSRRVFRGDDGPLDGLGGEAVLFMKC